MKKIMTFALVLAGVMWVSTTLHAQSFGYLSYSEVMKSMPEYTEAQNRLAELKAEYDKELTRSEENFSKLYAEYLEGQKTFAENILMKRQKELQMLMDESILFKEQMRLSLQKTEEELMDSVKTKLNGILEQIGTEMEFDYILNTDGNNYPYINKMKGIDINEAVMDRLKEE